MVTVWESGHAGPRTEEAGNNQMELTLVDSLILS